VSVCVCFICLSPGFSTVDADVQSLSQLVLNRGLPSRCAVFTCLLSVGKMQLLKSGRVRLIALDGKAYEVSVCSEDVDGCGGSRLNACKAM
jgi:hypothetical protein